MHDFLTVGAAAPLQEAGALALALPDAYYDELAAGYARAARAAAGDPRARRASASTRRSGAYYVMTEIDGLGWDDDVAFARHLVEEVGVAVVPGLVLLRDPRDGAPPGALRVLQEGRDAGRGGAAARAAAAATSDPRAVVARSLSGGRCAPACGAPP